VTACDKGPHNSFSRCHGPAHGSSEDKVGRALSFARQDLTRSRTRPNDLPLIAVPRLLATLLEAENANVPGMGLGSSTRTQVAYQEIEALNNLSILEFPPERIASSLVDLWQDLVSAESCEDFLRYHRGWIAHAVLLGCRTYTVTDVIERVIEVACCLDLLCQEHLLAVKTIESLKDKAVSRLTAWEEVQAPLIQKMNEITRGLLAHDVPPESRFRAARDSKLEYWILSRAFAEEEHLMAESLAVQSQSRYTGDVETRITNLEAMLLSMNYEEVTPTVMDSTDPARAALSETELSGIDEDTDTDTEKSIVSSSDAESLDDRFSNPVQRVARQTRERISLRLENLKNKVHSNAKTRQPATPDVDTFSIPPSRSTLRSIDLLDQRTIFRISATKDGKSGPRRPRPAASYTNVSDGAKVTVTSIKGRRVAARDLHTDVPTNDGGRWKKNVEYAPK
jgi:hypothetical protein